MTPSQKLNYDMINDRGFDSVHHHGSVKIPVLTSYFDIGFRNYFFMTFCVAIPSAVCT
jgi:hypothetical protein